MLLHVRARGIRALVEQLVQVGPHHAGVEEVEEQARHVLGLGPIGDGPVAAAAGDGVVEAGLACHHRPPRRHQLLHVAVVLEVGRRHLAARVRMNVAEVGVAPEAAKPAEVVPAHERGTEHRHAGERGRALHEPVETALVAAQARCPAVVAGCVVFVRALDRVHRRAHRPGEHVHEPAEWVARPAHDVVHPDAGRA